MKFSMHLSVRISSSVSRLQKSTTTPGHDTLHSHFKSCGTRRATVSTETTAPSGVEKQVLRVVPSDEEIATEISEKESHTTLPRGGFTLEEMRKQDKKSLDVLLEAWVKIGDEDGEEGLKEVKDAKNEKDGHEKKKNEDQAKQKKNNATASYENGDNASAASSPSTSLSFTSDDLCAMSLEDLYGLTSLASSGDDGGSDYGSKDVASRVLAPETFMISESKGETVGDEGRERARELLWFLGSLDRFGSAGEESGEEDSREWRFGLRRWQGQGKESEEHVRERDGMCRLCGRCWEKKSTRALEGIGHFGAAGGTRELDVSQGEHARLVRRNSRAGPVTESLLLREQLYIEAAERDISSGLARVGKKIKWVCPCKREEV